MTRRLPGLFAAVAALAVVSSPATSIAQAPPAAFVNWESPHVHPLDLTPDGSRLLAVNTADARLEVFSVSPGGDLALVGSAPVGLDPVSVRARSNTEAWVVNHISDSISIVDLTTFSVRATLKTRDEPCDVIFAGTSERAFVSCQAAEVLMVFDPADLAAAATVVPIIGESPRALARSNDGQRVYVAIFDSGNKTTILGGGGSTAAGMVLGYPLNAVSDPLGPYAGVNPPPNSGMAFSPPRSAAASVNMRVGLIVRKNELNQWMDDNNRNWTSLVSGPNSARADRPAGWDLYDHDVAIIETSNLNLSYATGLMNICMSLAVNPVTDRVSVIGTEALNQIRFEPNVKGIFIRVNLASFDLATITSPTIVDLNSHLGYEAPTVPQPQRDLSIGDPRAIVWDPSGALGYVAGMGSSNVIAIDQNGDRLGALPPVNVGEGPTGLALLPAAQRLFVMNRFDGSISIIDTSSLSEMHRVAFHDATPVAIKVGRKHLFDTRKNSGLGQAACASCHVDGRTDRLAWDLGDPTGNSEPLTGRNLGMGIPGLAPPFTQPAFAPFHPMKGPMTTQTLQDIIGKEPHHWRGDRMGIEEFNGAFIGLQGDDTNLTPTEMQEFENYLATMTMPPNPFRNFDNTLPTNLPLPGHFTTGRFAHAGQPLPNGNAVTGMQRYRDTNPQSGLLDNGAFACVTCHTLPTGAGPDMTWNGSQFVAIAPGPLGQRHLGLVSVDGSTNISIKIPQTRTIYKKTGFNTTQVRNTSGFGVLHDGSVDSIERFVSEPVFRQTGDQSVADMVAFMLAFSGSDLPAGSATNILVAPGPASKDSRASVGVQVTLASSTPSPAEQTLINQMLGQANLNRVGLIARTVVDGQPRGAYYTGSNTWQTDRAGETITHASLLSGAAPGEELTITVVQLGTQVRLGADRDSDTFFDRTELDVCSDPADPQNFPGSPGSRDFNGDLFVDPDDLADFITCFFLDVGFPGSCPASDFNGDGFRDPDDLSDFVTRFFTPC